MGHGFHKSEKGVMLILFACLLPFFLLCAGFAVDLGRGFVRHSQLQNAADAAVLAAAYQYPDDASMWRTARSYMHTNLDPVHQSVKPDETWDVTAIVKRPPKDSSAAKGMLLTLYAKETVDTYFMGLIGIHQMPVSVRATCKIVAPSQAGPGVFGYAFLGARDMKPSYNRDNSNAALNFNSVPIRVVGKVHTNGYVYIDDNFYMENGQYHRRVFVNKGDFTTSVYGEGADRYLWSTYQDMNESWHDKAVKGIEGEGPSSYADDLYLPAEDPGSPYRHFSRIGYYDGTPMGQNVVAPKSTRDSTYAPKVDISYSASNPMTQAIYQYVQEIAQIKAKSSGDTGDGIYYNLGSGFTDWRRYNVIIASGDISVYSNHIVDKNKPTYVISLNGNITFSIGKDGWGDTTFKALAYAPNGTILYNEGPNFEGSLVGQTVKTTSRSTFTWNSFGFGGGSGGSSGGGAVPGGKPSVSLHADDDSDYEAAGV